jgi:formate-dependent nitrite reductase membrane component NrfD
MSRRTGAARLAWSMCAVSLTLTALSLLLLALNLSHPGINVYDYWLENTFQAVSFSIIGAIVASRLPANPVSWLFCAAACSIAVQCLSAECRQCGTRGRYPANWG